MMAILTQEERGIQVGDVMMTYRNLSTLLNDEWHAYFAKTISMRFLTVTRAFDRTYEIGRLCALLHRVLKVDWDLVSNRLLAFICPQKL
jgi:hypothetical protein